MRTSALSFRLSAVNYPCRARLAEDSLRNLLDNNNNFSGMRLLSPWFIFVQVPLRVPPPFSSLSNPQQCPITKTSAYVRVYTTTWAAANDSFTSQTPALSPTTMRSGRFLCYCPSFSRASAQKPNITCAKDVILVLMSAPALHPKMVLGPRKTSLEREKRHFISIEGNSSGRRLPFELCPRRKTNCIPSAGLSN